VSSQTTEVISQWTVGFIDWLDRTASKHPEEIGCRKQQDPKSHVHGKVHAHANNWPNLNQSFTIVEIWVDGARDKRNKAKDASVL